LAKHSQKNIALVYQVMLTKPDERYSPEAKLTLLFGKTYLAADFQIVKIPLDDAFSMKVDIPAVGGFDPTIVLFGCSSEIRPYGGISWALISRADGGRKPSTADVSRQMRPGSPQRRLHVHGAGLGLYWHELAPGTVSSMWTWYRLP